jgi:hypothetical protein
MGLNKYNLATGWASLMRLPKRLHNSIKKRTRPAQPSQIRYEVMDLMVRRIQSLEHEIKELKGEQSTKIIRKSGLKE